MIRSDLANRLAEMIFKETVDRTDRRAITSSMGAQMEESKPPQTGGSAECSRWGRNNAASLCFMTE